VKPPTTGDAPGAGEKKVFLAGEGSNELGDLVKEAAFRRRTSDPAFQHGVIEAFLRRVSPSGWHVSDGLLWKSIPKYRAGKRRQAETLAVLGLCNKAAERRIDVLVFCRDQDDENKEGTTRRQEVEEGIQQAREMFPDGPVVVGGMAVLRLESWVAAALGQRRSEELGDSTIDEFLRTHGITEKDTAALREAVLAADLDALPDDAGALRAWLEEARVALSGG
jgi:hypothetical protein